MSSSTHYQLLGLPRNATAEQIRRAYRAQAKSLHPDVNPSKDAAKRFAKLAAAYETLSDAEKRRIYDRRLAAAEERDMPAAHGQSHYSWDNIAASRDTRRVDISEIDELYDTFFTKRPAPKAAKPPSASAPSKPKPAAKPKPSPARKRSA
jgi:DnaJ-class molecular chaperone